MTTADPSMADAAPARPARGRRRALMLSVPVVILVGAGFFWLTGGRYVTTENAYVDQPLLTVSAEVSGRIASVDVTANQEVAAGAALFTIDPTPFQTALDRAEGALAAARLQVEQLRSTLATAQQRLSAAEQTLEIRNRELARQTALAEQDIAAGGAVDAATLAARSADNEVMLAREGLGAAAAALGGDPAIATDDVPAVMTAMAQLAAARQVVGQLRAAYATAQAQAAAAEHILDVRTRELERQQSLADQGITANAALDEALLAEQTARDQVALSREGVAAAAAALGGDPDIATDDVPAVRTALAQVEAARLAVGQLRTAYSTAEARLAAAESVAAIRASQLSREESLADQGIAADTALDAARLAAHVAENDVALAREAVNAALAALGGDPAIATDDVPAVRIALAERETAARNLSETQIVAPVAGLVTQTDGLNLGQHVAPGSTVLSLVETGDTWIVANFKETQLESLEIGQPVEVEVDAWPGLTLHGTVDSFSSATGSQLSLLPAQNATGNWVKVVQRLPVRIRIEADPAHPLRDGMSAHVSVDTGHSRLDGLW